MPKNLMLFFGAGASKPLGIPTNREFYDEFLRSPDASANGLGDFPHRFYDVVRNRLAEYRVEPVDLEAIMTILTALADKDPRASLLGSGRAAAAFAVATGLKEPSEYLGSGVQERANQLLAALRRYIRTQCQGLDTSKLHSNYDAIFEAFTGPGAQWNVGGKGRPIEGMWNKRSDKLFPKCWCFTTNYDRALEEYFEDADLQYHAGWSSGGGARRLDPWEIHRGGDEVSLHKLHGSIDFIRLPDGSVTQSVMVDDVGRTVGGRMGEQVLIFPTQEKELFRFPFIDFFEEFVRALREAAVWAFFGFSFTDDPIRRLVVTEALRDRRNKKILVVSPGASTVCSERLSELFPAGIIHPVAAPVGELVSGVGINQRLLEFRESN